MTPIVYWIYCNTFVGHYVRHLVLQFSRRDGIVIYDLNTFVENPFQIHLFGDGFYSNKYQTRQQQQPFFQSKLLTGGTLLLGSFIQYHCKSSASLGKICRMASRNQKTLVHVGRYGILYFCVIKSVNMYSDKQ